MADQPQLSIEEALAQRRAAAQQAAQGQTGQTGQAAAAADTVVGTGIDVAKGLGSGVERGTIGLPGIIGDLRQLPAWAAKALMDKVLGAQTPEQRAAGQAQIHDTLAPPTSQDLIGGAEKLGVPGVDYKPTTGFGQAAQTVGEMIPGAVIPGQAGMSGATGAARVARGAFDVATQAVAPALASEAAQYATKDTPLAPYAGPAAAIATSLATGRLTPPRAAQALPGYEPSAVAKVNRAIADEGGHAAVAGQLAEVGPEARLIDAGPNLQSQGEALVSMPGPAKTDILREVRARNDAAGDRITEAINRTMGNPTDYSAEAANLVAARRSEADRLYGRARAMGPEGTVDTTPVIDHIASQLPVATLTDASKATPIERALIDTSEKLANRTDVASLHNVKESLDDQIGAATRAGNNTLAAKLGPVRDRLVAALDRATVDPATGRSYYQAAREQYASDSAVLRAHENGASVFDRDVRPRDLQRDMRAMSDAERVNFRQGAREQVEAIMDNARNDAGAARALFDKGANQDKLRALIGTEEANDLLATLHGEARKQGTFQRMTGQSATAGRLSAQKEFPSAIPEVKLASSAPTPGQLLVHAGGKLLDVLREPRLLARRAASNQDVSRLLLSPQASQGQLLQQLQQAYGQAGRAPGALVQAPLAAYGASLDARRQR